MDGTGSIGKLLGGVTTVVIVGLVVSNWKGVASILNSLGNLYGTAAVAATGGHNYPPVR